MTLTQAQIDVVDNMCPGSKLIGMGARLSSIETRVEASGAKLLRVSETVSIAFLVTAEMVTATKAIVYDGSVEGNFNANGYIVQVYRAGILLDKIKCSLVESVDPAGLQLTLESNGADYVLTAGDLVSAIVW